MLETPSGNQYIQESGYYILKVRLQLSLPSLGYKVIRFKYDNNLQLEQMVSNGEPFIENDYYKVTFKERDVELILPSGEKIASFITLEDCANAGDTYDFSPLKGDKPCRLKFERACVEKASSEERMKLEGVYELPIAMEDRLTGKNSGELKVKLTIILHGSTDRMDCNLEVDNQIYSHRLRVLFHTGINSNTTIASLPFGYITRESGSLENWEEIYSEKPVNIEPMMQSVSVSSPKRSFTLFTKGLKEYEHMNETIALTLLATTGQLGKPDLMYRPGRASGDTTKKGHVMIATEGAQLIGKHYFSFAIFAGERTFDEQETAIRERQYNQENMGLSTSVL